MTELVAALGLVLVIEGMGYALAPRRFKVMMARAAEISEERLRVGGIADRPADHDVICAVAKGLRHVDGALLVVHGLVLDGPDTRGHDEQLVIDEFTQPRRLEPRRDHAIAPGFQRRRNPAS